MYQNTIEEIKRNNSTNKEAIEIILQSMSIYDNPLNKEILASAHSMNVEQIEDILDILAKYLVIEKSGGDDGYVINSFANEFVLVNMAIDPTTKAVLRQRIMTAVNESRRNRATLAEDLEKYSDLKDVITDWLGDTEEDCFAIDKAFVLYENIDRITPANKDYEIEQADIQFNCLIKQNSAHPYVYHQRARMLLELRIKQYIHDEYDAMIEADISRCLMLLDENAFRSIKATPTYPSILWIYSIFLKETQKFQLAAKYADDAVQMFRNLGIRNLGKKTNNYYDALAVQGLVELSLYAENLMQVQRLKIARANYEEITKNHAKPKQNQEPTNEFAKHLMQLKDGLDKYAHVKIR
jgi:hypothetical protein